MSATTIILRLIHKHASPGFVDKMLQSASSTVRRRSASLLVQNEGEDVTTTEMYVEKTDLYTDFQGKPPSIEADDEQDVNEKHSEWCRHRGCGNCCHSFFETLPGEGPPDLQQSSSAKSKASDDFPTSARTDSIDHSRLLPSGQLKLTNKWPPPSTLKYLAVSAGYQSVGPGPAVPSLEHGQGSILPLSGRWTPSKIWLLLSSTTVLVYGTTFLLWASVTWFDAWAHADVMAVTDHDILVLITAAATLLVFSSMLGISGTMLNSRPLLAIYTLLLWPDQVTILVVGYVAYKRVTFNFDRKINFAWSHLYTVSGRQIIQDSFNCCGFYNTMHEAAPSKRCYLRASIPGCRDPLFDFERTNLTLIWKVAFALATLQFLNMIIALLCSNHVTSRFGKGLTPQRYRLCSDDIKAETRGIGIESRVIESGGHHDSQDRMARRSKGEVLYVD